MWKYPLRSRTCGTSLRAILFLICISLRPLRLPSLRGTKQSAVPLRPFVSAFSSASSAPFLCAICVKFFFHQHFNFPAPSAPPVTARNEAVCRIPSSIRISLFLCVLCAFPLHSLREIFFSSAFQFPCPLSASRHCEELPAPSLTKGSSPSLLAAAPATHGRKFPLLWEEPALGLMKGPREG
jgi:hypothetical protein